MMAMEKKQGQYTADLKNVHRKIAILASVARYAQACEDMKIEVSKGQSSDHAVEIYSIKNMFTHSGFIRLSSGNAREPFVVEIDKKELLKALLFDENADSSVLYLCCMHNNVKINMALNLQNIQQIMQDIGYKSIVQEVTSGKKTTSIFVRDSVEVKKRHQLSVDGITFFNIAAIVWLLGACCYSYLT